MKTSPHFNIWLPLKSLIREMDHECVNKLFTTFCKWAFISLHNKKCIKILRSSGTWSWVNFSLTIFLLSVSFCIMKMTVNLSRIWTWSFWIGHFTTPKQAQRRTNEKQLVSKSFFFMPGGAFGFVSSLQLSRQEQTTPDFFDRQSSVFRFLARVAKECS